MSDTNIYDIQQEINSLRSVLIILSTKRGGSIADLIRRYEDIKEKFTSLVLDKIDVLSDELLKSNNTQDNEEF